jgi:hypothetical protein
MLRLLRLAVIGAVVAMAAACDPTTTPSASPTIGPSSDSLPPEPSAIVADNPMNGPWLRSPIQLGDPQIASISDACAGAARAGLGEVEANLPTALVDARGENVATAILADDERAIECRARIDSAGGVTIDRVLRLAPAAAPPDESEALAVTDLLPIPDREGDRLLIMGRVGTAGAQVKVQFDGEADVIASSANGWFAAWWPGHTRSRAIVAVDPQGAVIAAVPVPRGDVDGELGAASWWLDPAAAPPTAASVAIHGLVQETACASGRSPEGRIQGPLIELTVTAVTVTFGVRHLPGGQDCQGNPAFPVTFELPDPLGERPLLDGSKVPPRDASKPPQ